MRLGHVLRKWRRSEDIGLREAAKDMGLTLATLQRLEAGDGGLDGRTLKTVLIWLMTDTHGKDSVK